jgi:hypothetical protein
MPINETSIIQAFQGFKMLFPNQYCSGKEISLSAWGVQSSESSPSARTLPSVVNGVRKYYFSVNNL